MTDSMWAHVRVDATTGVPTPHMLDDHLNNVAELAGRFAGDYGKDWAHLAGLWHDLGKFRPGFQRYIRQANNVDAHIEGRIKDRDKTHSAAGALWAEHLLTERFGSQGQLMARVLQYTLPAIMLALTTGTAVSPSVCRATMPARSSTKPWRSARPTQYFARNPWRYC